MRIALAALAATAALALSACGSGDEPAQPEVERVPETIDDLPKLPRGYKPYSSRVTGVSFGRPPGWKVTQEGVATLLSAPDQLVVMSVSADRTDEALAGKPDIAASRTFSALEGYEGELDPSEPRPFKHRYEGAEVRGEGVSAKTGVRQNLRVVVLEREGATVVTAVIAENAKRRSPFEVRQASEALRTLRTRPVG